MRRSWSILVGAGILLAVAAVCWQLIDQDRQREGNREVTDTGSAATSPTTGLLAVPPTAAAPSASGGRVAGVVLQPQGRPAVGAPVTLHRLLSAWPEWRRVPVEQLRTGTDGTFRFEAERAPDLVVSFEHSSFAGDLQEAPPKQPWLVLQLQPGFELGGSVTNDIGAPVAGCRVVLEPMAAQSRRAVSTTTSGNGRFRFTNVAGGTVRVLARNDSWQPTSVAGAVVGVDRDVELQFTQPALEVRGSVVAGASQQPVAGATILASWPAGQLGLIEPATAVTGADGTFRLPGLGRGNLWLEVRHEDHAVATRALGVGSAVSQQTFELQSRTLCAGRLIATEGSRLPADRVIALRIRTKVGELSHCALAADGVFAFPDALTPGDADIELFDDELAFARSSSSSLTVRLEEAPRTQLPLEVRLPGLITGRVVTMQGAPVAGANLFAERSRQTANALLRGELIKVTEAWRQSDSEPERLVATTGADGTFRVAGQRPGKLPLRLVHGGHGMRRVEVAVPRQGVEAVGDVVLEAGCRVAGIVQRHGEECRSAHVTASGDGVQAVAVTDSRGTFVLEDLQPGEYRIRARYANLPPIETRVDISVGSIRRVVLEFPVGRLLSGTVVGSDGTPVEGAVVMVRGLTGAATMSNAAGEFTLQVPPRAIELEVAVGDRARRKTVPVDAEASRVRIQVDTPPACTVNARVVGLPGRVHLPGALLRVVRPDGGDDVEPYVRWVEMQNGMLRHPWFPAGRQRLTIWCEDYAPCTREVDLAAAQDHRLEDVMLEPGCRLRGSVLDAQGKPVLGAEAFLGEEADLDLFAPQLRSAADGSFALKGVTSAASILIVRAPGHAVATVSLQLPHDVLEAKPKIVRLDLGATIEVTVGEQAAEAGGMVLLQRAGRVVATAEVDSAGVAVFTNRAAGDYTLMMIGEQPVTADIQVPTAGQTLRVELR